MLPLAVVALVSAPPAPQTRNVGQSDAAEACSVSSEAWWRMLEPLALFAALQPQEPLFVGSKRVEELRSLGDVESAVKAGKPTVIMFYAPWCPHCRNTKPVLDKVAERLVNIEFKQIDASGNAEVRGPYGVTGYPTIKYFDAANLEGIKYEWHGANEDDLRGFLERAMVTALSAYQAVALTADGSGGWILDERTFPLERGPWSCPEDYRSADHSECLKAVQQASCSWAVKGGLRVKGLKMVNSGERKRVPRGCSYSVEAEMAIYNKNPNGTSTNGRMYHLACIALSHETLETAHEEQADSNKAHKANTAHKEAAHRANKASRHSAKGARVGGAPKGPKVGGEDESDPNGEGGAVEFDIPGEVDPHDLEGGPCPSDPVPPCPPDHGGPGQEPCPHSSHPDVGCHMPGAAPQCNEVHKAHPDHDPALPDCDLIDGSGDPWAPSPPPSSRGRTNA